MADADERLWAREQTKTAQSSFNTSDIYEYKPFENTALWCNAQKEQELRKETSYELAW